VRQRITTRRILRWLLEAAILLAALLAIQAWQQRDVPSGPAPNFAGQLTDGGVITLSDWRARHPGRAVALHFWAEWCPICKAEAGSVTALQADHPVLTVAMQSGPAAQVAGYLVREGLAWQSLIDADGGVAASYGLKGVPAWVVIDGKGNIRSVSTGYTTELGMRLRLWWAERF
jgi:thiol-disulfide isomerase/thioredoxin